MGTFSLAFGKGLSQQGTNLNQPPSILNDGNTVAWYDWTDKSTLIHYPDFPTQQIYRWNDKSGNGNTLKQDDGNAWPVETESGVLFDLKSMKTDPFVLVQPEFFYMVIKQIEYIDNKSVFDGNSSFSASMQQRVSANNISIYGGSSWSGNAAFIPNKYQIIRALFNGANSKLQIDNETPITGNFGTASAGGFTLGSLPNLSGRSKIEVKEIIIRKTADSSIDQAKIYNYLAKKFFFLEIIPDYMILFVGDSTISYSLEQGGFQPISTLLSHKFVSKDISYPGQVISQAISLVNNAVVDNPKASFIQIGLNDLGQTSASLISEYQSLVNATRAKIGSSAKIILSTMIPCNRSSDPQWTDLNEAIRGNGLTPITGANGFVDTVDTDLNAGDNTLNPIYDYGDGLHENNSGRQIIANLWDAKLTELGI